MQSYQIEGILGGRAAQIKSCSTSKIVVAERGIRIHRLALLGLFFRTKSMQFVTPRPHIVPRITRPSDTIVNLQVADARLNNCDHVPPPASAQYSLDT